MTDRKQMSREYAVKFINEETAWPPGWTVRAGDRNFWWASNNVDSSLIVVLSRESRNSSLPDGNGKYNEPWTLEFPVGIPDHALKDKDALVFYLLEKIVWCEEHEDREFCRYRKEDGTWYAPFHPHRGYAIDQHRTPEWLAQYRDPHDRHIAGRKPAA